MLFVWYTYLPIDVISGINVLEKFNNLSEYVNKVGGYLSSVSQAIKKQQAAAT